MVPAFSKEVLAEKQNKKILPKATGSFLIGVKQNQSVIKNIISRKSIISNNNISTTNLLYARYIRKSRGKSERKD